MNLVTTLISASFVIAFIIIAVWVGIYIALPVFLIFVLGSFVTSLVRAFAFKNEKIEPFVTKTHHRKSKENQIIDVEYEEIK